MCASEIYLGLFRSSHQTTPTVIFVDETRHKGIQRAETGEYRLNVQVLYSG